MFLSQRIVSIREENVTVPRATLYSLIWAHCKLVKRECKVDVCYTQLTQLLDASNDFWSVLDALWPPLVWRDRFKLYQVKYQLLLWPEKRRYTVKLIQVQYHTCFPEFPVSEHRDDDQQVAKDVHNDGSDEHTGQRGGDPGEVELPFSHIS